jgi:hypothetical protein
MVRSMVVAMPLNAVDPMLVLGLDLAPAPDVEERHTAPILCVHELEMERAAARFSAVRVKPSPYTGMTLAMVAPDAQGQKRPADAIARAVMVARIATGEIEDSAKPETKPRGPYRKRMA